MATTGPGNPKDGPKMPLGALTLYREQGVKCARLRQCKQAIHDFNVANEVAPEDKRTLVERAKVKMLDCRYAEALKDAEKVLKMYPEDIHPLYLKALALYDVGEFEQALIYFHRGWKMRKEPPYFREGVYAAEETIEDCIGDNVGHVLMNFRHIVRKIHESNKKKLKGVTEEQSSVMSIQMLRKLQQLEQLMSAKYLGGLTHDRNFVHYIIQHPNLPSPNKAGSIQLRKIADDAYKMINEQMEILRTRRPMYAIRYEEATFSESLKRRKLEELRNRKMEVRGTAIKLVDRMRMFRAEGKYKEFVDAMERAKNYIDLQSGKFLARKEEFLEAVYNITALFYLDTKCLDPEAGDFYNSRLIKTYFNISSSREVSNISVLKSSNKIPFINFQKIISKMERRLMTATTALERAWIYHEMSRCYTEMNKGEQGKLYAKRCLTEARHISNYAYCINASVMLAKAEMLIRNQAEARVALQDGIDYCMKIHNEDAIQYLTKCFETIDETVDHNADEQAATCIEGREKVIVRMMSDKSLRGEIQMIFQHMGNMPANRRMSLMPGIRATDAHKALAPGTTLRPKSTKFN